MGNKTGLVLLAAGNSSRMGESKQLLNYNGKTLLEHAVMKATESGCSPVVVVLGAHPEAHKHLITSQDIVIVENKDWEAGIGSSIAVGVSSLMMEAPEIDALILMVCDQPFLSVDIIEQLIEKRKMSGKRIIGCAYSGTIGTPALFSSNYFAPLKELQSEQGAKALFYQHSADLETIDFPQGTFDIDTKEDYYKLISSEENKNN